ncbi:hypothetical protein M0811_11970 [Anaeramoeba ignava]|uniref:VPS9 domain-containing protein n=1 Tax=Anaeramoeba ignava TaxID=1746090 RepID=A0A9Q0R6J4_ANAIG|nr:hypothetical protein M0811_11970 [Anaeramoeba ignava]
MSQQEKVEYKSLFAFKGNSESIIESLKDDLKKLEKQKKKDQIYNLKKDIIELKIEKEKFRLNRVVQKIQIIQKNQVEKKFDVQEFLRQLNTNRDVIFTQAKILRLEGELLELSKKNDDPNLLKDKKISQLIVIRNKIASSLKKIQEKKLIDLILSFNQGKTKLIIDDYIQNFNQKNLNIPPVRDFINQITSEYLELQDDTENQEDDVKIALENYIFPKIYKTCLEQVLTKEKDDIIFKKCCSFANIVQEQLHISPKIQSSELIPFIDAISFMKTLPFSSTPTDKLYTILNASQAIYNQISSRSPNITVGADDFVDVLNFVIIKAGISNLRTTISFINEFCDEDFLNTELGYYLVSVDLSANFIENLSADKLQKCSLNVINRNLIVFEPTKFKELASKTPYMKIQTETFILEGYQLYSIAEWNVNVIKFFSTFVYHTGNKEDKVKACIINFDSNTTESQQALINKMFFSFDIPELYLAELPEGNILISNSTSFTSDNQTLFLIPSGDFEQDQPLINLNLNLIRLVGNSEKNLIRKIEKIEDLEEKFRKDYQISKNIPINQAVNDLVLELQVSLQHLDLFPSISKIDGVLNDVTLLGIQGFKTRFLKNKGKQTQNKISYLNKRIDQELNFNLFSQIKNTLQNICSKLSNLGFSTDHNVIKEPSFLVELIKHFQVSSNIFPDGRLGIKTAEKIEELFAIKSKVKSKN